MFAVFSGGAQPYDTRQRSIFGRDIELAQILHVGEFTVLFHGVERGQRIPNSRCVHVLPAELAARGIVATVGLRAAHDIVRPRNVVLMKQVRKIGPGVIGTARRPRARTAAEVGRKVRVLDFVDATRRISQLRAARRPFRDHEQMLRQTPRRVRFEHAILQHEVMRVTPVIRKFVLVVITHHVTAAASRIVGARASAPAAPRLASKAVHFTAVDIGNRMRMSVGTARIEIVTVVIRAAAADRRIRNADALRNAIGAGIRSEIRIERSILLHDDYDVTDCMNARGLLRRRTRRRERDRRRTRWSGAKGSL